MKKINDIFSYVYYISSNSFYKKNSKTEDSPGWVTVGFIQTFIITIFLASLSLLLFDRSNFVLYKSYILYGWAFLYLTLSFYNKNKYKYKYEEFHERWKDEPKEKRQWHGFLIVLVHFVLVGIMIGLAYIP